MEIILSEKKGRRRHLGVWGRRIRNVLLLTAGVLIVGFSLSWGVRERRIKQAQLDISRISHATRLFRADFDRCPENIDELFSPPDGSAYLTAINDPWGRPYKLVCPSRNNHDDVDVVSTGPTGEDSQRDDIRPFVVERR